MTIMSPSRGFGATRLPGLALELSLIMSLWVAAAPGARAQERFGQPGAGKPGAGRGRKVGQYRPRPRDPRPERPWHRRLRRQCRRQERPARDSSSHTALRTVLPRKAPTKRYWSLAKTIGRFQSHSSARTANGNSMQWKASVKFCHAVSAAMSATQSKCVLRLSRLRRNTPSATRRAQDWPRMPSVSSAAQAKGTASIGRRRKASCKPVGRIGRIRGERRIQARFWPA